MSAAADSSRLSQRLVSPKEHFTDVRFQVEALFPNHSQEKYISYEFLLTFSVYLLIMV